MLALFRAVEGVAFEHAGHDHGAAGGSSGSGAPVPGAPATGAQTGSGVEVIAGTAAADARACVRHAAAACATTRAVLHGGRHGVPARAAAARDNSPPTLHLSCQRATEATPPPAAAPLSCLCFDPAPTKCQ